MKDEFKQTNPMMLVIPRLWDLFKFLNKISKSHRIAISDPGEQWLSLTIKEPNDHEIYIEFDVYANPDYPVWFVSEDKDTYKSKIHYFDIQKVIHTIKTKIQCKPTR